MTMQIHEADTLQLKQKKQEMIIPLFEVNMTTFGESSSNGELVFVHNCSEGVATFATHRCQVSGVQFNLTCKHQHRWFARVPLLKRNAI